MYLNPNSTNITLPKEDPVKKKCLEDIGTFGKNLFYLRKKHNISRKMLVFYFKQKYNVTIHNNTLIALELNRGITDIKYSTIIKIAHFFSISVYYLMEVDLQMRDDRGIR